MSERYRDCRSWQPRHHLTQASKGADADADSKHRGMFAAVDHYMQQAAQRAKQATLEQREQKAVEALDALQLTLGRSHRHHQHRSLLPARQTGVDTVQPSIYNFH